MTLRDDVEAVVRAWHQLEVERGAAPIIDFDFYPQGSAVAPVSGRLAVHARLTELAEQARQIDARHLIGRLTADLAYLGAQLGERATLPEYVRSTQGCSAVGWSADYIAGRGELASAGLESIGIGWHDGTDVDLRTLEEPIDAEHAGPAIRAAAADCEPAVRKATQSEAPYELTLENASVDAYWAYWLDGSGRHVRLRLNPRNARFTEVGARQFALHEVLGHGLQAATFAQRCASEDVPWVRLLSVHGPTQVLLEGLAQALPLFVTPDDEVLVARVHLDHYLQLVRSELHLAINRGVGVADCASHAKARVPFWTDEQIADLISDRGANPLLRSYLWAYPAGFDWFVRLAESDADRAGGVLRAAYRDPLTPDELQAMWAGGPCVGGSGDPQPPRGLAPR